jgi:hypothetical protein
VLKNSGMIRNTVFLAVIIMFSCTKSGINSDLSTNESKWNRLNIVSYEFTLRINCFCPLERVGPHLIKVVNNEIISVNNLPYDPAKTGELYTIDQLFTLVEKSIERNPYIKTIEYNSTYGFPVSAFFDFNKQMADEEIGYEVTDFILN